MTNAFITDLTTCLLDTASVPRQGCMCRAARGTRFNTFKFTLGTILVFYFLVRNYPPSVGHVYQNTLRYCQLLGLEEGSFVNRPTKLARPVA
jgi:hypothetical protein